MRNGKIVRVRREELTPWANAARSSTIFAIFAYVWSLFHILGQ